MSYPLRFQPILREYLWGGRRLAQLGKPLGAGGTCAESWEVCDHAEDQTVVLAGPWQGKSLGELVRRHGQELLGRHHPQPRFPLLLKLLDANKKLSVQVHPGDVQAARLDPPDLGKTEAWIVLDAEPGSVLYAGLKRAFDRAALEREVQRGTCDLCLHQIQPQPGDCIFIPAGVCHAIGEGLLIAEIQQASDVTYRLFDWNRVGPDGQPRQLHIDEALAAIDYQHGPVAPQVPQPTEREHVQRLVECDKFVLEHWKLQQAETIGGDERCHIVLVTQGEARIDGDPIAEPLVRGSAALIPAAAGQVLIEPNQETELLTVHLP